MRITKEVIKLKTSRMIIRTRIKDKLNNKLDMKYGKKTHKT